MNIFFHRRNVGEGEGNLVITDRAVYKVRFIHNELSFHVNVKQTAINCPPSEAHQLAT